MAVFTLSDRLAERRPLIMGILNVTPDSFSDGGRYRDIDVALRHAMTMIDEGADIIDVGGESTRPGSEPVVAEEQLARVMPVILKLVQTRRSLPNRHFLISIDTSLSRVAEQAVQAGADIINDVSAGTDDDDMYAVAARLGAPIVLMHRQGTSKTMQDRPAYVDVVAEVKDYLRARADAAMLAGIDAGRIVVDPGIGFGKSRSHNLALLGRLDDIVELGYPVLLGCSRKRFMGSLCQEENPADLLGATVATTVMGMMAGVSIVRVHDVRPNRQAVQVAHAIEACASSID
ncbi:dihydropteroate synthase [Methyloparacoccus murrellii]